MLYRTSTRQYGNYLFQRWFDSKTQLYSVQLYSLDGSRIKNCEPSDTEDGAEINAFTFLHEYEEQ